MDYTIGRPHVCILRRGGVPCPVSAAWQSCVAAQWSKYHCYKQAPLSYMTSDIKVTLISINNKSAKWHCGRHTTIKKNVVNYDNLYERFLVSGFREKDLRIGKKCTE